MDITNLPTGLRCFNLDLVLDSTQPGGLGGPAMWSASRDLSADPELVQVTALLLAESGYAPLNPLEWIERWEPQVVLLSVAAGDEQGRPDPGVLQAVEGRTLLRTDQNGWIELSTDGEKM